MEYRAVILSGADELLAQRENNLVGGGLIAGAVAFAVRQFHILALQVVVYDLLCRLNGGAFQ